LTTLTLLLGALGPGLGPGGDGWDASGESGAPTYRPLQDRWVTNQRWFINSTDDVVHQNKTIRATRDIIIFGNLTLENVQLRCLGDITVFGTLTLKDTVLRESGDIDARNGSHVYIYDSAVLMYSWRNQEPLDFDVRRGANLTVEDSFLTETIVVQNDQDERPNNPLYWKFLVNGTTRIDDSHISYLWGDLSGYQLPNRGRTSVSAQGGIQILYDDVVITNTTVRKSQSSGIFMDGTSPVISGCNLTENQGYGFSAIGGAPEIADCYIAYNGYHGGIIGDSDGTYLHNNTIAHNGWMGAIISNSTALVENNEIYGNDYGMWIVSGGDSVVRHNTINETDLAFDIWWANTEVYDNTVSGLQSDWESAFVRAYLLEGDTPGGYGGSAVVRDNTVDNFTYALVGTNVRDFTFRDNKVSQVTTGFTLWDCTGDDFILQNNSISNRKFAFELTGSPDVVSLNNGFTSMVTVYDPYGYEEEPGVPSSSLWVKWYADVMVLDQNDLPVSGASVAVTDRDDNSVFSGQTAANGKTAMFLATDYWQNRTITDPHNPHHFTASKGSDTDSHTEAINSTETVTRQWPSIQQGDWVVTTTEKHSYDLKLLQGNLLVKSGGALYLTDYVLKMANTLSTAYSIEVEYGGKIVFENVSALSNLAAVDHTWDIAGEAYIRNSTLKDIEGGLHVISDDVEIRGVTVDATGMDAGIMLDYAYADVWDSEITDSEGAGLYLTGAFEGHGWLETLLLKDNLYGLYADGVMGWVDLDDSNLTGNAIGAYITGGSEVDLWDCTLYMNGDGMKVDENSNGSLLWCDVGYNTGDGLVAESGFVFAIMSVFHHNGDDGIDLSDLTGIPIPEKYQLYFSQAYPVPWYSAGIYDNTFYSNADKDLAVTDTVGVISGWNTYNGDSHQHHHSQQHIWHAVLQFRRPCAQRQFRQ
jgi:parallel beta-helix repeat protein